MKFFSPASLIFALTLSMWSCATWAITPPAKGTVTKVQGSRAIVQFDQVMKVGDVVQAGVDPDKKDIAQAVGTDTTTIIGPGAGTPATREYAFGYGWKTSSFTMSGVNTSGTDANITWWFNMHQFELASIFNVSSSSAGTNLGVGGIAQFDFIRNDPGAKVVPGAYGKVTFGSFSPTTGASSSTTNLGIGASLDWFPFIEHAALNISVEYDTISYSVTTTPASSLSLISGVKVYF